MSIIAEWKIYCLQCGKEQPHRFLYVGHPVKGEIYLKKMECEECGYVLQMDRLGILESYLKKISKRVISKPFRILQEAEEHPCIFLKSWPKRSLSKPYRMAKEVFEIIN